MSVRSSSDSARYFAAKSEKELRSVCAVVQMEYGLPTFEFDCEDDWEFGRSEGAEIAVNVTKTRRLDTISTWTPCAPREVNYQIILWGQTHNNFTGVLRHALDSDVIEYVGQNKT